MPGSVDTEQRLDVREENATILDKKLEKGRRLLIRTHQEWRRVTPVLD